MRLMTIIAFSVLFLTVSTWQLNEIQRSTYSFQGYSTMYTERIKAGKISKSLYILNNLSSLPDHSVVRKLDQNETLVWMSPFAGRPSVRMYDVDSNEKKVILGVYKQPFDVLVLNTTIGALICAQTFLLLTGTNFEALINSMSDGSGYYIITNYFNAGATNLCKHLFANSTNVSCQLRISSFEDCSLLINHSAIFLIEESISDTVLYLYKVVPGSTTFDWIKTINWPGSCCYRDRGEAVLSQDSAKIYSYFSYGLLTVNHFTTFNVTDGSLISSKYISTVSNCCINGLYLLEANI